MSLFARVKTEPIAASSTEPRAQQPSVALIPRSWRRLSSLDKRALLGVGRLRAPWATRLMRLATTMGDAGSWMLVNLILFASGRRLRRHGILLSTSTAAATITSQALKRACSRPRPSKSLSEFEPLIDIPDAFSFPSGHTAAAFAAATALSQTPLASGLLTAFAMTVALSRVYLGAHYPLDVAAGAGLGIACGLTARGLLPLPAAAEAQTR